MDFVVEREVSDQEIQKALRDLLQDIKEVEIIVSMEVYEMESSSSSIHEAI